MSNIDWRNVSSIGPTYERFHKPAYLLDSGDVIIWEGQHLVIMYGELHGRSFAVMVRADGSNDEWAISIPADAMIDGVRLAKEASE